MRAVQVSSLEGPRAVELVELPEPRPDGRHVLIDVHAAGVSFPDLLMTQGRYQRRPELPFVPGVEIAGLVRSAPGGLGLTAGDRVAAFVRTGGWAEVVAADPRFVFRLPDAISLRAGAGVVMNYLTAHLALVRRVPVRESQTVVVHGAAGGLGTACVQIAAACGARTVGVVSTEAKAERVIEAGGDHALLAEDWQERLRGLPDAADGADLVLDPVGGARLTDSLRVLRPEGTAVVLGFAGGEIPQIPANRLLLRNITVAGVAWGSLIEGEPDYPARQWKDVLDYVARGHVRPLEGEEFAMAEAGAALLSLAERKASGKVTLSMTG
jgi:NADPH:quinone reductase